MFTKWNVYQVKCEAYFTMAKHISQWRSYLTGQLSNGVNCFTFKKVICYLVISIYFNLFQSISIYFNLFQSISIYFNLFQSISIYFNLFQSISIYFNLFLFLMCVHCYYCSLFAGFSSILFFQSISVFSISLTLTLTLTFFSNLVFSIFFNLTPYPQP